MPKSTAKTPSNDALRIAKLATKMLPAGGAPATADQVRDIQLATKGRQLSKFTGCPAKTLERYAKGEIEHRDLPEKTRNAITHCATVSKKQHEKRNRVYKSWPRKHAAILNVLATQRKPRAPKPATPEPQPQPETPQS